MTAPNAMPPPGSYGWPILGTIRDTAEFFLRGWEPFFQRRVDQYREPIFKINLFQPTIAVLDFEGVRALFSDRDLEQDYGFSWAKPPLPLVGHTKPTIFENGEAHDRYKRLWMDLISDKRDSVEAVADQVASRFFSRWVANRSFGWADELENLAVSIVFPLFLQMQPDPSMVRQIYNNIFAHFFYKLQALLPSSGYSRSLKRYGDLVALIRSSPGLPDIVELAGRAGVGEDDGLEHKVAFLLGVNGYLGVQSLLKSLVAELSLRADLLEHLRDELKPGRGIADRIASPALDRFIRETLRMHPPVFFVFGRAARDRVLRCGSKSYKIQKGELVMGVIPLVHLDAEAFPDPAQFRPERFAGDAASRCLIWPRGPHDAAPSPSDRTCPGKDVAVLIAKVFLARLVTGYRWELESKPEWSRTKFGLNVAAPIGPLNVTSFSALT